MKSKFDRKDATQRNDGVLPPLDKVPPKSGSHKEWLESLAEVLKDVEFTTPSFASS